MSRRVLTIEQTLAIALLAEDAAVDVDLDDESFVQEAIGGAWMDQARALLALYRVLPQLAAGVPR